MKNLILFIALLIFFKNNTFGQNNRDSLKTKVGFTAIIKSKSLEDSIKLFIHEPFKYASKPHGEYSLVVLLDPHCNFKVLSSCTEYMAFGQTIPFCIVVGFPQYKWTEFNSDNIAKNTEKLISFFEKELKPYIFSKYNITNTIIWGQGSSAGLLTSYMMLEKPEVFDGYISDVPDFSLISDKVYSSSIFDNLHDKSIYYYLFGNESKDLYNELFLKNLESNAPKNLNWKYSVVDESNFFIYLLRNYMNALELFFNEIK